MNEIIFFCIALIVCVCAFLTVTSRYIFRSAVWLALCLLGVAGVYFYLEAEFLGVIQVLVYVGGIITLFIFAIKLTARIDDPTIKQANQQVIPSAVAVLIFSGLLFYGLFKDNPWAITQSQSVLSLQDIGRSLMTNYLLPFEFISITLLAAMIGAIVIGKEKK